MRKVLFEKDTFSEPLAFKDRDFLERISLYVFYELLLCFLTFVNCEGPYLVEGFLHNLCSCFNIVLSQLGNIMRTRNKFVEIVAASELRHCYLIINSEIKGVAVPTMSSDYVFRLCLPVKLADGTMTIKKDKISLYLTYNIVSLRKMAGKIESFFRKNKLKMNL